MKKIQIVDILRGVSILVILQGHLTAVYGMDRPLVPYFLEWIWYRVWVNHPFGVYLFFVVSGFLITRLIASQPGGLFNFDMKIFYVRRAGRILPLLVLVCFWGFLLASFSVDSSPAFVHCFKNPNAPAGATLWLSIATFSMNWVKVYHAQAPLGYGLHWDVLWSLAIEEQFYFFYPWTLKMAGNRRNLMLFLSGLIILGPVSILAGWRIFPYNNNVLYNSFASFQLIAMGCLLHLACEKYGDFLKKEKAKCGQICGAGIFILAVVYGHTYVRSDYWWTVAGVSLVGVSAFLILLGGIHLSFFESRWWNIFSFPGSLSYGMYLWHATVLYFFWPFFFGLHKFMAFFIFSLLSTGLAWLSYRYFELPSNKLIRKIFAVP